MNITDALKNVKEGALEGRKLETWCDDDQFSYRYDIMTDTWQIWTYGAFVSLFKGFCMKHVFGTWHVREVKDG